MSALGGDDGNFGVVGVIGTFDRATDVFPNSGQTTARRSLRAADETFQKTLPQPALAPTTPVSIRLQKIWQGRSASGHRATK
jgi:hypothetical protein